MINFFFRKNIYIKVLLGIFLLFAADNALLLLFGKFSEGRVMAIVVTSGTYKTASLMYPVVQFDAAGKKVTFNGNQDTPYREGDAVKVIYRPWMPSQARIYTLSGMSRRPLIQFVICITVWTMLYSSFRQARRKAMERSTGNRAQGSGRKVKFREAEAGGHECEMAGWRDGGSGRK